MKCAGDADDRDAMNTTGGERERTMMCSLS